MILVTRYAKPLSQMLSIVVFLIVQSPCQPVLVQVLKPLSSYFIHLDIIIHKFFLYSILMDVINVADVNEEEDYMDTCNSSCKKKKNY